MMGWVWLTFLIQMISSVQQCCPCGFLDSDGLVFQNLSVGVIQNGVESVEVVHAFIPPCNVTWYWHSVNLEEVYQVFRTVQVLDNSPVDLIVLFDDRHLYTVDERVLNTNKPLILWGKRPTYNLKDYTPEGASAGIYSDLCDVVPPPGDPGDPDCIENLQMITQRHNVSIIDQVKLIPSHIIASLVTVNLKWKYIVIFHETHTETEVSDLVDKLARSDVMSLVFNVDQTPNITAVLMRVYEQRITTSSDINFVILCRFNCIRRVIRAANWFDTEIQTKKTLLKQVSRWLLAVFDHEHQVATTLKTSCANDLDNVAVIAFPKVKDGDPKKSIKSSMRQAVRDYILHVEDALEDNSTYSSLVNFTVNKLRSNMSGWLSVSQCQAIKIDTLMWIADKKRDFSHVGYVSMTGEVALFAKLFPNTNYGYNKREFLVSTLPYAPFVVVLNGSNDTQEYGGMCMDLLKELARTLNFTYRLTEPPDGKWGSQMPNGSFNGMIGQLEREEVDMVAADISIQKAREMVMDFAFPFYFGDTSVLLKKPDPNARKWRTLLDPFKWEVLTAIGIALPVASFLAFLVEKCNPYYSIPENQGKENCGLLTFHDSFWYMYSALLCQGGVNLPDSTAGRTIVSCWWLFSIVIVGTYCGNLIAFLTVNIDKPPFNTLEEMANTKGYRWGLQAGTVWEDVFRNSSNKEFRAVGDRLIEFNQSDPSVMATNFDVQLANVKEGHYGWIGDTVVIEVEMAKDCQLMMIKERFLSLKYAFGFTNNSPHTQIFSAQMLSIHESGLLQVWKRRWWPKATICSDAKIVTESKPISVVDVQSAFYVAAGGAVLGGMTFVLELVLGYVRKRKQLRAQIGEMVNSIETIPRGNN